MVKDFCQYVFETYGRFPAFIDPMYVRLVSRPSTWTPTSTTATTARAPTRACTGSTSRSGTPSTTAWSTTGSPRTDSRTVAWTSDGGAGMEVAEVAVTARRLRAAGAALGADPVPYRLEYRLESRAGFATARMRVVTRGPGGGVRWTSGGTRRAAGPPPWPPVGSRRCPR